jgi:hypothetical protein
MWQKGGGTVRGGRRGRIVRRAFAVLAILIGAATWAGADEGQWPPEQLAAFPAGAWKDLQSRGLTLSAAELWDGSGGGLMTAAVNLGGCTAAFVSPDGLVATNHHCAFGAIQLASTPERNYLRDGFVAATRADEAPARGGANRVLVIKRFTDVTGRVRGAGSVFAAAKTDLARWEGVERAKREIVAECEKQPSTRCDVAAFYEGREYRLMEQLELRDVRLVYAPPRGVGDYGGEEDNFRWPRHTGDFAILRAYVAPDGTPAAFAPANVPYRPAHWLRVSDRGVAPGDLVMVMGYPGRTQRFLDADSIANQLEWFFPLRARTNADLIAILEDAGKADADTALRVAGAIKGMGNSMTNARGQVAGLARNRVVERVRGEEERLRAFLARDTALPAACRTALDDVRAVAAADRVGQERGFFLGMIETGSGYLGSALAAVRWAQERARPEADRESGFLPRDVERARGREKDLGKTLAPAAGRRTLAYLIARALAAAGDAPIPSLAAAFGDKPTADAVAAKLAEMDAVTRLGDEAVRLANLDASLATLRASDDPYVRLAVKLQDDLGALRTRRRLSAGAMLRLRPALLTAIAALRAADGRQICPDANGTLRISFASVKGYIPKDGLIATPQTSVLGLVEKETGVEPFASPAKVLAAVRAREWGRWADPRLTAVPIDFLADGDTTGGNSGSPVVNGRGELVGLNFDRVWENVAGDFGWNAERSRNVILDVRYALWLIDRVDGARALLDELLGPRVTPAP